VDAESEARDVLEHVVMATRDARSPIIMFTNDHDSDNARAAVAAGVSAYARCGGFDGLAVKLIHYVQTLIRSRRRL
jgi:AmiR/NasT family two-component response regulator